MGKGKVFSDPLSECEVFQYKSEETTFDIKWDDTIEDSHYEVVGWYNYAGSRVPKTKLVTTTKTRVIQITTLKTWLENTCSPDDKYDIITETHETDLGYIEVDKSFLSVPEIQVLNGVGVPNPIPDFILSWLIYGGLHPFGSDPIMSQKGGNDQKKPTKTEVPQDSKLVSSEQVVNDAGINEGIEVRAYGFDRDDDDDIYLNQGPGFNARDKVMTQTSLGAEVTRESISKHSTPYNNYHIQSDWTEGIIVSATFTPLISTPKDCGAFKTTYGWWRILISTK